MINNGLRIEMFDFDMKFESLLAWFVYVAAVFPPEAMLYGVSKDHL